MSKKGRKNVRIDKLSEGQIIPLKQDFMFTQIFNDENYDYNVPISMDF